MEAYSATVIANAFIKLAKQEDVPLTNMKLQKLVYIAHGYCLALLDRPLIENDVHAFEWGPVIPTLYNKLKKYGAGTVEYISTESKTPPEHGKALSIVKSVWESYKNFDALKLSAITHELDTPWNETWNTNKFGVIPTQSIKNHYLNLLNERTGIRPKNA